jgi:hypothetical protein
MDRSLTDTVRHVPVRYSVAAIFLAVGLFLLTVFVEVTIIVESPALGDISDAVWLFSQVGKADATGLDPVGEADMNNSKTTGRWQVCSLKNKNLRF